MSEMTVALRLLLEGRQFDAGFQQAGRSRQRFVQDTRREFKGIGSLIRDTRGQLAGLGIGFGLVANASKSAQLDKSLTRVKQTANATREQVIELRKSLFAMARDSGREVEGLRSGFDSLIASGLQWQQALATIKAINPASAVTGASEETLAGALSVAAASYNFDLSQPGLATKMLDQMTVAGRSGNAELSDLAGIFSRIGVNAKSANFQFEQTLGFVEGLGEIEKNPERLATLADSTLRVFTNAKYKQAAEKATGIGFYTGDGKRRDPLTVLNDIAAKFQLQKTERAQDAFIAKAFGETDLDTKKGLMALLAPGALADVEAKTRGIAAATGAIARDYPEAISSAIDQANRLKTTMREVGDEFAMPINKALADLLNYGMNSQDKGGLGLSPGQTAAWSGLGVLAAGAAASGATALLSKFGSFGKMLGAGVDTAAGLAQGQLVEKAGLGTAVFVTNWPGSMGGGGASDAATGALTALGGVKVLKGLPATMRLLRAASVGSLFTGALGAGGIAAGLGGLGLAGGAGYAFGTGVNKLFFEDNAIGDAIGEAIVRAMAAAGNDTAADALKNGQGPLKGELTIRIDQDGRARVGAITAKGGLDLNVATGMRIFGATP